MIMGIWKRIVERFRGENADLGRVMAEMAAGPNMKVRRVLYLELLKATFLLPLPNDPDPSLVGKPLKELQLVTHPGEKGEVLWIAFTSRKALHQWRPQFPEAYAAIQGKEVFALAARNGVDQVIINPAGPIGGRITRMELEMLAEGTLPVQGGEKVQTVMARQNTVFQIGPLDRPLAPELLKYFREHLAKEPQVHTAYLAKVVVGGGTPHLLLGVLCRMVLPEEKARPLMAAIGQDVGKFLGSGELLDMVPLDDGHEWTPLLREKGTVVYRR